MTSDLLTDIGAAHLYTYFRSSLFNNMDKVRLTNQIGSSVQTGDVLVLDTANDESFIAGSDSYPYRPVFVVPEDIDDTGAGSTKTIADSDAGWVYRPGAYVPLANVDEVVSVGEYLALGSTSKSFTGLGVGVDDCLPPVNARAYALAEATEAGQIPVVLLGDTANAYMGARVYNDDDIAITASTVTALDFDQEEYDPAGLHEGVTNPSRLTVPSWQVGAVPYTITGHVTWSAAPSDMYIAIRLNGTDIIARQDLTTTLLDIGIETTYELSAGDYVELIVYTTTSSLDIKYYAKYTPVFAMVRAGD